MLSTIMIIINVLLVTYVACLHIRLNLLNAIIHRHEKMLMSHGIAILQTKAESK